MKKLIARKEMESKFALSRASVFRLTEDPSFPDAIRILGSVRWDEDEVDEWIANQPRRRRANNLSLVEGSGSQPVPFRL